MESTDKKSLSSKKKKRRIIGYTFLIIFILLLAIGGILYYQLQPAQHFKAAPVVTPGNTSASNKTADENKLSDSVLNILLIGSDQRKDEKIGHSDSMIIVHVDLKKKEYHTLSIPRDTRVYLDGFGYTKLTSVQYIMQATKGQKEGVQAAVETVGNLTGIPINYYVETNYWGFKSMVDAIGDVEVNVPFDVTLTHPWYKENKNKVIKAGTHTFDGKMVSELVHERYSLKNGEFGRQQLQQAALVGIAKSALNPNNITHLPSLVNSISDFLIATNMTTSDIVSLGLAVKDLDINSIHYHQLHGENKKMHDDVLQANNDQFILDPQDIEEVAAKYFID